MSATPRIVLEAEKIVHDLWAEIDKAQRWRRNAVARTTRRRQQEAAHSG